MAAQQAVVARIAPVAEDVVALDLDAADTPLLPWTPGAHVDLTLPNWLTRQYSLCGDPGDATRYRVAVRLDRLSRGGSEYIHRFLRAGRPLAVSAPRNHFALTPAPGHLFIAGGIGITPFLSMMDAIDDARLIYTGRHLGAMPFAADLRERHGDRVRIVETERDGRPDLRQVAAELAPGTLVHCCGPAAMTDHVQKIFPGVRLERFRPQPRTHRPNAAFEVLCARSGRTLAVPPNRSLLDALADEGVAVASGCREGVCGSCELRVLDGEPEHRDDIGAPAGRMYACVSRALGPRLVLDL
ncbi:PDR/VanB family oxidoreductase [Catenuloplanes japonicus]|uniref:PDR/VanB family oxidoreductase n=1 Tax=Catenuloplanes japonicus TaxID=33876 RepID=UPI000524FC99|nr:PDR/VanB family oxidoreductase [Catenuloplanes japonicus]